MKSIRAFCLYSLLSLTCVSCIIDEAAPPDKVEGYAPVYITRTGADTVLFAQPKNTVQAGKIVLHGNILYQVEQYYGIHIIDLTDPEHANKIGFYEIFGCTELTLQGSYLYTNSGNDFLVIDISMPEQPRVADYKAGYFSGISFPPPPANGYFECPDPAKGIVAGWEKKTLNRPQCRY